MRHNRGREMRKEGLTNEKLYNGCTFKIGYACRAKGYYLYL